MRALDAAFGWARFTGVALCAMIILGAMSYISLPREASPDVQIPMLNVSISMDGISPEDGERLIGFVVERAIQGIEGLSSLKTTAQEGSVNFSVEFDSGLDMAKAKLNVQDQLDMVARDLPDDANAPVIREINVSLFPVISVALSGSVSEAVLVNEARTLKRKVEALSDVLEVSIRGERPLQVEVLFSKENLEGYGLDMSSVLARFKNNNQLIQAGSITQAGSQFKVKVPGLIETEEQLRRLPIMVTEGRVITLSEVAEIRTLFNTDSSLAKVNGETALVLEVTKRIGGNIIAAIDGTKAIVEESRGSWLGRIQATYMQDDSENIRDMLGDLEANILTGIVFVSLVVMAFMGASRALLVGLSIPFSFLISMIVLSFLGISLNNIVLFGLILVLGLLVDGAIVTVELADRYLREGQSGRQAFTRAAGRMFWPIVSSTATTLAVFFPLLFWPGITGDFMSYLPATVITVLTVSIFVALMVVPFIGGFIAGNKTGQKEEAVKAPVVYKSMLTWALDHPWKTLMMALIIIVCIFASYPKLSSGVEFFPSMEPDFLQVQVRARGTLSTTEKENLVDQVQAKINGTEGVKSYYSRVVSRPGSSDSADLVGVIQIDLMDWHERLSSKVIEEQLRLRVGEIKGIIVEIRKPSRGPSSGDPVNIELRGTNSEKLVQAVRHVQGLMEESGYFKDVSNDLPLPVADWELNIDRELAAYQGVDLAIAGAWAQLVTGGLKLAELRPLDYPDEIEVLGRMPEGQRSLSAMMALKINTGTGQSVMMGDIATIEPRQASGAIIRIDGERSHTIKSGVVQGKNMAEGLAVMKELLTKEPLPVGVRMFEKGDSERQNESMNFLKKAFAAAMCLMLAVLLLQFNSFRQSLIVFSAVVLSMAGVLLGLMVLRSPFVIVMGGIGVISLAGIVVNNNIVLIDAFNEYWRKGMSVKEAAMNSALDRFRPVMLTSITTVLGLMPMVAAITMNYSEHTVSFGAPSSQWWVGLSSTIAGGLVFVTAVTLILTPVLLILAFRKR
jgi:multidrug efflux pump